MIDVNITVSGLDETIAKMNRLGEMNDFSPEMQKVGDYLQPFFTDDVYESQGGDIGEPWQELSPQYSIQKEKTWGSNLILVVSGHMRESNVLTTSSDMMAIKNSTPYIIYHQDGTAHMPQRMLFKLDDERMINVIGIISTSLAERIANL